MARVWSYLEATGSSRFAPMWPFPALYLIEVVVLAAVVLLTIVVAHYRRASFVAWFALGALSAIALLGAMSIGLNVALAVIFLVPAIIVADYGQLRLSLKVGGFVLGVLFQGAFMFGIIQYLIHRPISGP